MHEQAPVRTIGVSCFAIRITPQAESNVLSTALFQALFIFLTHGLDHMCAADYTLPAGAARSSRQWELERRVSLLIGWCRRIYIGDRGWLAYGLHARLNGLNCPQHTNDASWDWRICKLFAILTRSIFRFRDLQLLVTAENVPSVPTLWRY